MGYRLDELEELARELGMPTRRVDEDRLDVIVAEGCSLTFSNWPAQDDTLVGFDRTPWHSHGIVQLATGNGTYVECDELDFLVGLGSGELVVVSRFLDEQLSDRWLAHKQEALELRYMQRGEELRVLCLSSREKSVG
jgi:hypothetical protein